MSSDKSSVKNILIITLSNLGDIILTTPVLTKLHEEFPDAKIDVITGSVGKVIFNAHPAVREIIPDKRSRNFADRLGQVLQLRKRRYDVAVDLKNSLIPYLIGARFHTRLNLWQGANRHKKEEHLLKLSGLRVGSFQPEDLSYMLDAEFFVPILPEDKKYIDDLMSQDDQEKKIVVINAGAKSPLKRWGADKYAHLADMLIRDFGCRIFLTGTEEDIETVKRVTSSMRETATDLCCKTSVGALAELMRRSSLVVTNDSAPLHVASAVNAPTIAIFGPFDEKKYGPLSVRSVTVKPHHFKCRPCNKPSCEKNLDDGCISTVEVEDVFLAAKKMLLE